MRFTPKAETKGTKPVRTTITTELYERYEATASESKLDLATVFRQALEFAAGDSPDVGKKPKRIKAESKT